MSLRICFSREVAVSPGRRSLGGAVLAVAGVVLSGVFLANPTLGVFEFLPDNLPFVGNLDEVLASAIFFSCMSYLGINLLPTSPSRRSSPLLPEKASDVIE